MDVDIVDLDEWNGYVDDGDGDELLDLDDDVEVMTFTSVAVPKKKEREQSSGGRVTSRSKGTSNPKDGFGGVDLDVEVVDIDDDDDMDSLPSISSPPPQSSPRARTGYDNGAGFDFGIGTVQDKLGKDKDRSRNVLKDSNSKKGNSSSRKGTYEDLAEVDDFFLETEYSSLADYLADIEARKKPQHSQASGSSSQVAFNSKSGGSSSASTVPDSQESQASSSSSKTRKRKSKSPNSSFEEQVKAFEAKNKPTTTTSYQVNKSGGSKKKAREASSKKKPASASSSATSTQESTNSNPSIPQKVKSADFRKMIVLHIPEDILTDELAAKLIEREIGFEIVERPRLKNSILFEHHATFKMVGKDFQVQDKIVKEMDENIIITFPIEKNLDLLQNEVDLPDADAGASFSSGSDSTEQSLTDWMKDIQRKHPGKQITLLIQGLEAYLKKVQRAAQKEYRDRVFEAAQEANAKKTKKAKSKQKNNIKLNRNEIQNALIGLQLFTGVNYRFYENTSDLVALLYPYSKAVSEANQKKEREKANQTNFDWYAVADSSGGIPVEMDGKGTTSLWISQLCQFPSVGQERALAISRVYPSPRALIKAYNGCSTPSEGRNLLADIQITVGVGPFAKKQKLGPQASKKIYRFFTSSDGEREV